MSFRLRPARECTALLPPALGAGSAAVGVLAIVGWMAESATLLSLHPASVPVAPSTGVSLALLGLALAARSPDRSPVRAPTLAAAAIALAFAVGRLAEVAAGRSLGMDAALLGLAGVHTRASMAVPTALGLVLAAAGVLLLARQGAALRVAATMGACVGGLGLAFALGYVYGRPLLYGSGAAPVAFGSSVGLLCLGLSIAAHAVRRAGARARRLRATRRSRVVRVRANAELRRAHHRLGAANQELEADVTRRTAELRQAHLELSASERELQTLFEAMTDVIVVLDGEGRYHRVAPTRPTRRIIDPQTVLGRSVHEVLPAPVAAQIHEAVRRALECGCAVGAEYAMEVQGEEVAYQATGVPLGDDLVMWIARDVTDQRRAEAALRESRDQLRHAQKMEALGRLAGGVAHDFNNLLTAIKGTAQLLLLDLSPGSPAHEDVQEIDRAATRAAALTGQLLLFSRKQKVRPQPLRLNAVVTGAEKLLRRVIGEDVELRVELGPDAGLVHADPGQLEQVLMNLVLNARDAMPGGGRIQIVTRAEPGLAEGDPPAGWAVLTVRDTGTGMDEATRERIFEPFFTTKAEGRGTGLGLATVYGIVQQAGGRIDLRTAPGEGTTFAVHLPLHQAAEHAEARGAPARPERRTGTVLVVEDEDPVRTVARRVLERAGYEVFEAATGEEAARVCRQRLGELDLVLTDVVMGDMSGWRLGALVHDMCPGTPILFMSGYTDEAVLRHAPHGFSGDFIEKPFSPDALLARVDEIVGRRAAALAH